MKTKFLSEKYVPENMKNKLKVYTLVSGAFKECLPYRFTKKMVGTKNLFFDLEELPLDIQEKYTDMAIDVSDNLGQMYEKNNTAYVYDKNNVKVYVNDNTPLLPVVGKILPSDNVHAYTVRRNKIGELMLVPIVICIDCHWSDLFSGRTKYRNNVFCLTSDLSEDLINEHIDDVILLKDVPFFLNAKSSSKDAYKK